MLSASYETTTSKYTSTWCSIFMLLCSIIAILGIPVLLIGILLNVIYYTTVKDANFSHFMVSIPSDRLGKAAIIMFLLGLTMFIFGHATLKLGREYVKIFGSDIIEDDKKPLQRHKGDKTEQRLLSPFSFTDDDDDTLFESAVDVHSTSKTDDYLVDVSTSSSSSSAKIAYTEAKVPATPDSQKRMQVEMHNFSTEAFH